MIKDYYFQECGGAVLSGFSCCRERLHCSRMKTVAFLVPLNCTHKPQHNAGNLHWKRSVSGCRCGVQKASVRVGKAAAAGWLTARALQIRSPWKRRRVENERGNAKTRVNHDKRKMEGERGGGGGGGVDKGRD